MALPLALHTWSGAWSLPSIDPHSIAVASYLQLAFPGRWTLVASNDPDASPNGQLPYIEHGPHTIASLSGMMAYLSKLSVSDLALAPHDDPAGSPSTSPTSDKNSRSPDLNDDLDLARQAEAIAWKAIVESELGDLTNFTLWCPMANYEVLHQHLASSLPFPQSHYAPGRLRSLYEHRLTHVNLWGLEPKSAARRPLDEGLGLGVEKLQPPVLAASESQSHRFVEQQLLSRADSTLSLLSGLLSRSSTSFFFDSPNPTTLDLHIFSYLSLLLLPPWPAATLPTHIRTTYPALQAHTLRILSLTFPPDSPDAHPRQINASQGRAIGAARIWQALSSSVDVVRALAGFQPECKAPVKPNKELSNEEKDMVKNRGWWIAGVLSSTVVYLFASGLIRLQIGDEGDGGEEEEELDD